MINTTVAGTSAKVGRATLQGNRMFNADSVALHSLWEELRAFAVTVVDGISNDAAVAELSTLCAEAGARVGARRGALAGVLSAHDLVAIPGVNLPKPDCVMVLALFREGKPTSIAHVGDCRAYGWDGEHLNLYTEDQTQGQRLRNSGIPEDVAVQSDNQVINTVGRTGVAGVAVVPATERLIILTSDGVHKVLPHDTITALIREHASDPDACAHALVTAAREASPKDDATAAVIYLPHPPQRLP